MKVFLFLLCCVTPLAVLGFFFDPPSNPYDEVISCALSTTDKQIKCTENTRKKTIHLNPGLHAFYKNYSKTINSILKSFHKCDDVAPNDQKRCIDDAFRNVPKEPKYHGLLKSLLPNDLESEYHTIDIFSGDIRIREFAKKIAVRMPELTPCFQYLIECGYLLHTQYEKFCGMGPPIPDVKCMELAIMGMSQVNRLITFEMI